MKIIHINTWDSGGAAGAAFRLLDAQKKAGMDVAFLALKPKNGAKEDIHYYNQYISKKYGNFSFKLLDFANRIFNRLPVLFKKSIFFNRPQSLYRIHKHPLVKEATIIHLHAVPKFLDYPTFFKTIKQPIVWTMHDMYPASGGKHYDTGMLPSLESLEKKFEKIKQKALEVKKDIYFVSPSNWLKGVGQRSNIIGSYQHYLIPYCYDVKIFSPREIERKSDKIKILFVAENVTDPRKGGHYLLEAIDLLNKDVELIVLGNVNKDMLPEGENIKCPGFISDPNKLAEIYSEADVYVIASVEDNLPNTIIESHACGTPVVGFKTSGITEMIEDGKDGILVDSISSQALAKGIEKAIEMVEKNQFSTDFIAQKAQAKYSEKVVVEKYQELYNDLLLKEH